SCTWIANTLNQMGIPTVYKRDGRVVQGRLTSGLWTSTRVRNIIIAPVYKGVYVWGRRKFVRDPANPQRRLLRMNPPDRRYEIPCPAWAIVSPELWQRAVDAVHRNQLASMAHANPGNRYLLRGLVRCSCGLCYYAGTTARHTTRRRPNGERERIPTGT